ncbi:FMN-binding negative transcriptional regulator [Arcobacter sp. YIC-80]|uniref:FMN-binding negative transcriptional regulator n=1 Tax=Arcobacter sp. YIC-80 TaxID=3376683 RepID=UPI00384D3A9E
MYSLEAFKITDENIIDEFISNNPFAILTSENHGKIEVTHLPINRFKDGKLYGHLSKTNIHSNINETKEVCFIFNGGHAYISPTYYETSFNVPTWNYSAVHIYGNIKYINDNKKVWELLTETTEIYEGQNGWKLPQEERFKNLTKFLSFFEINVTNIEAKFKFNQNKSKEDIEKVIQSLKDNNQIKVANFMEYIIKL